jgi:pimeloyl-ACP methyl ester carboxylesterase
MEYLHHRTVDINHIRMHYVTAGSGPLLLLLHGFPEFWYSWRHQIAALSPHFTVVAPDLRGYNDTDKPTWGYELDVLVADVLELMRALEHERAIVVGHDWGGLLAWTLAMSHPQRVERLAVLNAPHPALMLKAIRTNPRQMVRSLYVALFQLPWLPEWLLSANDYALIDWALRGTTVRQDAFSAGDIHAYKDAISKPGALTAALNWYRALWYDRSYLRSLPMQVTMPTLLLWGESDHALGTELTYGTEQYVPDLRIQYIPACSHWVQQDQPELVNHHLLTFLADLSVLHGTERSIGAAAATDAQQATPDMLELSERSNS